MEPETHTDREKLAEATRWLLRLRGKEEGSHCFVEFRDWLNASEANRLAWQSVDQTWQTLGTVHSAYQSSVQSSSAMSLSRSPAAARRFGRGAWGRIWAAGGAAMAIVAICLLWFTAPDMLIAFRADYSTGTGEQKLVRLNDGTSVELGGASAISAKMSASERGLDLLEGEAFVDVAHDASRPFVVGTGSLQIKVLGTAFDVRRAEGHSTVALLRGEIEALVEGADGRRIRLQPGEQLDFDEATGRTTIQPIALEDIGAWRDNVLALSDVSVAEAIDIVRRYHPAWISLQDSDLAQKRISGLFDLSDPEKALTAIVGAFGAKVTPVTPILRVISRR